MKFSILITAFGLLVPALAFSAPKLQFQLQYFELDSCQISQANTGVEAFFKQIEKILPWIDEGSLIRQSSFMSTPERMYLSFNKSAALNMKVMNDSIKRILQYCNTHQDGTATNAIMHFAFSAVITVLSGEKAAKELVDLHEAGAIHNFKADKRTVDINSVMDIYNNYMGIEFGSRFRAIPEGRDPLEFFFEMGAKLYSEGKLKVAAPLPYGSQVCLFPKHKFHGTPHLSHFSLPKDDKRIQEYYHVYEWSQSRTIPQSNVITEADIAAVVNNSDPSQDPLFLKMEQYRASLGTCCE